MLLTFSPAYRMWGLVTDMMVVCLDLNLAR